MKDGDRASGSPRQYHRTRFRHVARAARTVNREPDVASCFEAPAHGHQAFNPPRDELPCAVPNPSRSITRRVHWPSKLTVLSTTMPRFRQNQAAGRIHRCQKAPIPALTGIANLDGVVYSDDLKTQCWTEHADDPVRRPREHRNLHPSPARKMRQRNACLRAGDRCAFWQTVGVRVVGLIHCCIV